MTKKYNEKDLINNEQHIYDCFSNTTAFLGLDRVEVSIKGEIKFDATKLQIFSKKNKKLTVIKYIDSRYEYIRINNSTFGLDLILKQIHCPRSKRNYTIFLTLLNVTQELLSILAQLNTGNLN